MAAALIISGAFLGGCQSTSTNQPEPKNACEKAKQAGDYNTPVGRTVARAICTGQAEKLSRKEYYVWAWREHTRQRTCQMNTGELCPVDF
ncbi:hypothetical protein [Roseibium aggregatum]|uniref:Uncharacterized protein n=1 Tax=Roseibium aggregatum TaxID=187304 RepID=A0A939EGQ7_9HYPH|nr:hypothetical protein [Roseibium aggregatum]MBN9671229.1 hypothetical protein [Roseibium aggregatum]